MNPIKTHFPFPAWIFAPLCMVAILIGQPAFPREITLEDNILLALFDSGSGALIRSAVAKI